MPVDSGPLREIAWRELFPWLSIVRAARLAIAPRLLILAALGLFLTAAGWKLLGWAYSSSEDPTLTVWRMEDSIWRWQAPIRRADRVIAPGRTDNTYSATTQGADVVVVETTPGYPSADVSLLAESASPFLWLSRPLARIFDRTAGFVPFSYTLLCGLWSLAVWALIGGSITRIVAMALAHEGRLGALEGAKFSIVKWPAFFLAPLFPLIGVLTISLLAGLFFGLIMRADAGVLVSSILWPLMLAASFVMAILLIGLMFGWPLMWPTISVEGTDAFDALSRSYSYTFQRPFHYLFYAIVAAIIGALASLVVMGLAHLTTDLSYWSASWGAGLNRAGEIYRDVLIPGDTSGGYGLGIKILGFWHGCVLLLGASYLYSYFWTAATAIYFLLRRHVDGTEMDEIWSEPEDETYGLPPLKDDPSGVPQVVDPPGTPG